MRLSLATFVALLGWLYTSAAADPGDPVPGEPGFVYLFDGKTTEGWQQSGPGGFVLKDGVLESYGGLGLYWYTKRLYTDFILRLDYKVADRRSNSGVYFRFPNPPRSPWDAVDQGFEVQIIDAGIPAGRGTGHIYSFQKARPFRPNPPGQWNQMEIRAVGRQYTVKINGEVVCEFTDTVLRGLKGYIGIQNHHDSTPVWFRNIRIKELKPSLDGTGFVHLFNGRDMSGWQYGPPGRGSFTVEQWRNIKVLRSHSGTGVLAYKEKTFGDCVLVVEWRVRRPQDNSGVFVRAPELPVTEKAYRRAVNEGYEIQILDQADPKHRTGAIYAIAPAERLASFEPGHWNRFEITMIGQKYTVNLNGEDVCVFEGDRSTSGYIALQAHDPDSVVEFMTIMVKELNKK